MLDTRPGLSSRSSATTAGSSSEVLLSLCRQDDGVADLLAAHGVSLDDLIQSHDHLRRVIASEPADWRLRLSARGGDDGNLELLLAICRSADSHAYQVLEHVGIRCAQLRRDIIERLRAAGDTRRRSASPRSVAPPRRARPHRATERGTELAPASRARPTPAPEPTTREDAVDSQQKHGPHRIDPASLLPLHGRASALRWLADAVGRQGGRSPIVVGPPGVGRTALCHHLATVFDRPVFALDATEYETEDDFELDLKSIREAAGIAILDDVDRIATETCPAWLTAMSRAWTHRSPTIVTISSPDGVARLSTWMPGSTEVLDVLRLEPIEGDDLDAAMRMHGPAVLEAHGVSLGSDAKISEITRWADRYLNGLAMPGRALDLLDLIGARSAREGHSQLHRATCLDVVAERCGLPTSKIEARSDQDALDLEQRLTERVVGHEHAVSTIAKLVRRNRAGFGGARPMLSALLLGPSGVGKTELAKALCEALFDRDDALVRLDMSEYAEAHAIARIVGAPPGYVGHEQGGALSDPLLKRRHCVVLLDEIEKAHRDVHQLLLQVFDEGRLTDGRGRVIDFRDAAIVMTSNLGAHCLIAESGPTARRQALDVARAAFPVELWNRIEAPLVMDALTDEQRTKICRRLANASSDKLRRERGIGYRLTDAAVSRLVLTAGRDPALGARPLRHLLHHEVESLIAEAVLRGHVRAGTTIEIDFDRGFTWRPLATKPPVGH